MSDIVNIPNFITLSRLIFLPLLYKYKNHKYLGFIWLGIFWGLDMIDGTIARYLNQTTELGKRLDLFVDYCGQLTLLKLILIEASNISLIRINIAKIHIYIMLFASILNVTNAHKARHSESRFKLVQYYNRNNVRNLFSGILLIISTIMPYILYKFYNKILDYIYLINDLILITIFICRTL